MRAIWKLHVLIVVIGDVVCLFVSQGYWFWSACLDIRRWFVARRAR